MKTISIIFFLLIFFGVFSAIAQAPETSIRVAQTLTPEELVREVFIKGNCKNVSNIQFRGADLAIGEFENALNAIRVEDGIILSSGNVKNAVGPNNSIKESTAFRTLPDEDKDLDQLTIDKLFDVAVLEFDFVPLLEEVSFKYVFASEEYCEFANSPFNDLFGFFVSGPGIEGPFADGAINVATLPDSEEYVSINSVNHSKNFNNYQGNERKEDAGMCEIPFTASHLEEIEYDGYTLPLFAKFKVIPCETYHIRLTVADVSDDILDSAVFLESKSFNLGSLPEIKAEVPGRTEPITYEDCLDGQFVFRRPPGTSNFEDLDIPFSIATTEGTATENQDFPMIPRNITIPKGKNSAILPINILGDGFLEQPETLRLELFSTCNCVEGNSAELIIAEPSNPTVVLPQVNACPNEPFALSSEIRNGVSPFVYQWNTGDTSTQILINIDQPTIYKLSITDVCGNQASDSILIDLKDQPTAFLSGEGKYCNGLMADSLFVELKGDPPWAINYTIDGGAPQLVEQIRDPNFLLPITAAGSYEIIDFKDATCVGIATGVATITDIGFETNLEVSPPSCPDTDDGMVQINILGGQPPFNIIWDGVMQEERDFTNLTIGNYDLMIQDANGCQYSESVILAISEPLPANCKDVEIYIPNTFSPNGDGINDYFEVFFSKRNSQQIQSIQIVDRWGNQVFFSKEPNPKWGGSYNGKKVATGVLFYQVILMNIDGTTSLQKGDLTLVR